MVTIKVIPYISPRIHLCKYSQDSCNITVVKIIEFVSGKICSLYQSLRNSSKVRFDFNLFMYVGIIYAPWSVVWTWWRIAREWRLEVPQKSTLGSSSKFWLAVNFVKIHSENIAFRYGFTPLGKHHISRGHSRNLQKKYLALKWVSAHFFPFHTTWK